MRTKTIFILPSYKNDITYMKYRKCYWENVTELEGCKVFNIKPLQLDSSVPLAKLLYQNQQESKLLEHLTYNDLTNESIIIVEDPEWFNVSAIKRYVNCKFIAVIERPSAFKKKLKIDYDCGYIAQEEPKYNTNPRIIYSLLPVINTIRNTVKKENLMLFIDDSKNKQDQVFFFNDFKQLFPQWEFIDLSIIKNVDRELMMVYFQRAKLVYSATMKSEFNNLFCDAMAVGCIPVVPDRLTFYKKFLRRYRYETMFTNFEKIQKHKKWRKPSLMTKFMTKINYRIQGLMEDHYLFELQCIDDWAKVNTKYYSSHKNFLSKIYQKCQI